MNVERRAEIEKRKILTLLGNSRTNNVYFHGIYRYFEFDLLERHPSPEEIMIQHDSRNKENLRAWNIVFVIKDLIAVTTPHIFGGVLGRLLDTF